MTKRVLIALFLFLSLIACSALFVFGLGVYASYGFGRDQIRNAVIAQNAIHTLPASAHYTVADLRTLGGSYDYHGGGVNDAGEVVGASEDTSTQLHGFFSSNGKMLPLPSNSCDSGASAINSRGQIAGSLFEPNKHKAVLWANSKPMELGILPGFQQSEATAMNGMGDVTGKSFTNNSANWWQCPSQVFLWKNGKLSAMGAPPDCTNCSAYGINDRDEVVGWALVHGTRTLAYLWRNGTSISLGTLRGGTVSRATAINNHGQIVGSSDTAPFFTPPWEAQGRPLVNTFLWQNGTMFDLGSPSGGTYCQARDINDGGVVVGRYSKYTLRDRRAFIWDSEHGMQDLNGLVDSSQWFLEDALAINNRGQILVFALPATRQTNKYRHLVLLSPSKMGSD